MSTQILRPNANVSVSWSNYTDLDDNVTQPETGIDANTSTANDGDDGNEDIWGFPGPSNVGTYTRIRVWAYGDHTGPDDLDCRVKVGGSFTSVKSLPVPASPGWASVEWTGTWTKDDFADLQLGGNPAVGPGETLSLEVAYIEVEFDDPALVPNMAPISIPVFDVPEVVAY